MVVSENEAKAESRSESAARRMKGRRKQMQAPGGWIARGYPGDEKWEQSSKPES